MIRLGKLVLHHCDFCNLPLLKEVCICGNAARKVAVTPPGDVRPAFARDRELMKEVMERQFGSHHIPEVVLLNSAPAIDKKDEVIMYGKVAGNLYYDIWKARFAFQPRTWYASLLEVKRGYVVADSGAVDSILKSSNLMAPGVKEVHEDVRKGDEVVIFDEEMNVIATGKARMDGSAMRGSRGMAVKVRQRGREKIPEIREVTWDDVIKANEDVIRRMVDTETKFIERTIKKYDLPYVVSFSGGKDSLVTLLLVLEAGFRPPLLFLNTGLEFEETVHHVHEVADAFGLELLEGDAGDKFWEAIDFFGIPAKDYRWCCKTCKLGVAAMLIKKQFPRGVLSFIGQRRYESEHRATHGKVWKNPWVHGQVAASPIQNWTALHVWLYLFMKKAAWNPLYEQGFERIGCWLCPASDMGEFALKRHPEWEKFEKKLRAFAERHNLPDEWLRLGLWRWRRPPRWCDVSYEITEERECVVEGNEERVVNFLKLLGEVKKRDVGRYEVNGITVETDGGIRASGREDEIRDIICRAVNCVGCGVCIAKCDQNAISLRDGRAWIGDGCIHCMQCMDECPVLVFT